MNNNIKIVFIISNLSIGGAQILVYDILTCLKEKSNIDLNLITFDSGEYISKFTKAGINVIDLKERGLVNPKIYFKLKRILKEIKPDIVHTHLNKADFYGRIAAKNCKVPVIFSTCHNYSTTHSGADINKKSFFDRVDNLVISYSGCNLIAISKLVKKYLINRNPGLEAKTIVIYNGIRIEKEIFRMDESERLAFRNELGFRNNDFIISIIARLEKQKGHLFFLNSVKDFLKSNNCIKILIVGEGSLRKEIEKFISINKFENQIKLTGFVNDSEKFFEISDLITVPSHWEGFGLVIIEAMIKRKIVLASDTGAITEIINDSENGFLFKTGNKESLLEKLQYVYSNINNFEQLKQNALEKVKRCFDIEKNTEKYYSIYNIIYKEKIERNEN